MAKGIHIEPSQAFYAGNNSVGEKTLRQERVEHDIFLWLNDLCLALRT
jgi:hypothetical protein